MDGKPAKRILRAANGVILLAAFVLLHACTHVYTRKGVYYRMRSGDTLAIVAAKYHVSLQDIAELNNIENVGDVKPGRSIYIQGVTPGSFAKLIEQERRKSGVISKPKTEKIPEGSLASAMPMPAIEVDHGRFSWPIDGEISSGYGVRHGRKHDGVDIRSPVGTPIHAAADGEVVFCKRMRGYGNLILLKHKDDYFTIYAHNSQNFVKDGAHVKRGQVIAKVGRTGRTTGPHVHFEVREGSKTRNPLFFLPRNAYAKKFNPTKVQGEDYGGSEENNP